jgi:hypothetical protein
MRFYWAAFSALFYPVGAGDEYSYEQNSEIMTPAGAKIFGRLY